MDENSGLHIHERAPDGVARGAFLLLHGMESHSGWFADCADRLVRGGWAVIAFDRPGWGMSPPRRNTRGHMESYRDFVGDVVVMAARARRKYGSAHLAGMSWGGMAALYAALRRGWMFDSVALLAPGIASGNALPPRAQARVLWSVLRGRRDAQVETAFRGEDFTRDALWREFIKNDPYRTRAVSAGFCVETLKMRRFLRENAGRRRLPPALCLLAGDDDIINNDAAARLCEKAGALVERLPRAAHTLIFEAPAQTAGILLHHAETARESMAAPQNNSVWIVGAGAVGGAVASLLAFGGVNAGVLAKASQLDAFRRNGLTLRCGKAVRTARAGDGIAFAAAPEELPAEPALVILAVKSFDTAAVLTQLRGKIPESACILSLQNGVENEARIAEVFPRHTVIAGAICAGLELPETGVVRRADDRGGLAGAVFAGDALRARSAWERFLPQTGMECRWVDGTGAAARVKYSKLMLNIGFNALNAATGLGTAAILADPHHGELAVRALREGFSILRAIRVQPIDLPGFPVSLLGRVVRAPLGIARKLLARQAGRSPEAAFSMRQDVLRKRQHTEIEELNGKIIALGQRLGVPTPANSAIFSLTSSTLSVE